MCGEIRGISVGVIIAMIIVLIIGITLGYGITQLVLKPTILTTTITETKPTTIIVTEVAKPKVRTLFDVIGRKIELREIPERVVSLAPSITEILFAVGVGNKIIGVDSFSNYPPEVVKLVKQGKIKVVGDYWAPDLEKIVELEPVLIIADLGAHYKYLTKFEELGLKVMFVKGGSSSSLNDIYSDILFIGEALNVTEKAYEVVSKIKKTISQVEEMLIRANVTRRKVLVLLGPPTYGFWTAGSGTYIDELIKICGGVNIASKYHGWIQISREEVISQDPEIIIITIMGTREDALKVIKEIMKPEIGLDVTAVRNKEVYVLIGEADDLLCRPGPRVYEAIKMLASIIHPEVFGEISRSDVISAKQLG
ncbi:hypothetical protein DRN86_03305 [Candidatus Geothermarchaeota archaeon]|mgnify:CR=1 FL=1|nr:MAG: hypothetical protein DRN86_03305 [Candidatus Geothermarchaeota archaeon]